MREAQKSFRDILAEKLEVSQNVTQDPSVRGAVKSHEKILFLDEFLSKTLISSLEKLNFRGKNPYPQTYKSDTFSYEKLLSETLQACKSEDLKKAVQFFYEHGERQFLVYKTEKVVTKCFRRLAHKFHPDHFAQKDIIIIDLQKSLFIELQSHYQILKDGLKKLANVS